MTRALKLRHMFHELRANGSPPEDCMPLMDAADEIDAFEREIGRLAKEALPAEERLQGARALVVYFASDVDRDEFVEIVQHAKTELSNREGPMTSSDKKSERCLHCEISTLIGEHIRAGLTINEILFKQVEAIADLVAGVGDRNGRRQFLDDIDRKLRVMTSRAVLQRQADGATPHTTMKAQ